MTQSISGAVLFCILLYLQCVYSHKKQRYGTPLSSQTKSFTSAIKDGVAIAFTEQTLFESKQGAPGVITEQWSGGAAFYSQDTIISIYVDDEQKPSIRYQLLLGHGMGFSAADESNTIAAHGPFGTKYISHEAKEGGLSHRYVIPFTTHIRITGMTTTNGTFWYWVHGVYNFPVVVTDFHIQLPYNAKLKLYKQENVLLAPLEFLTLSEVHNSSGLIFGFVIAANSTNFGYLEGCMRIKIDDEEVQFLSSGTEDIFESSYYFDAGIYHDDSVGLTYKANPGTMSAYKFFMSDPMMFTESMSLIWRSGETRGIHNNNGCPSSFGTTHDYKEKTDAVKASTVVVTTYTWVYLYQI